MEAVLEKTELLNAQETRRLVLDGYNQALEGKTKNFYSVCDRLIGKYRKDAI